MHTDDDRFDTFLSLSILITGFDAYRLRGTGQAEVYWSTLNDIVGPRVAQELLTAYSEIAGDSGGDETTLERAFRLRILSDAKLGPLARNLIKLWYVGVWYELPREWRDAFGENEKDRTFVVSADSYVEGLMWPAIGANPSGAKPLGYAMWATPPLIEP